jgi:hypothetical protein
MNMHGLDLKLMFVVKWTQLHAYCQVPDSAWEPERQLFDAQSECFGTVHTISAMYVIS